MKGGDTDHTRERKDNSSAVSVELLTACVLCFKLSVKQKKGLNVYFSPWKLEIVDEKIVLVRRRENLS